MKIRSYNEYDPIKSVIVGTASHANFPVYDKLFQLSMSQAGWTETPPPRGPVSQKIIDETNEDLDILAHTLGSLGATVYRPDEIDYPAFDGQYGYCPRDNLLVLGTTVIEAPMSTKARHLESRAFTTIKREAISDNQQWIAAPVPELAPHQNIVDGQFVLNNDEPVFDAANICKFDDNNLLYLISDTGNEMGAKWLQSMFPKFEVYTTDVYNSAHLDSTIVPIGPRHVVLNADRVKEEDLPWFICDMQKIWITDDMIVPQDFDSYPYASKWIAINVLAVGENRIICDKNQPQIIAELEKHGFTVIPLELRHSRTLGGGFHCVTLDLERRV